jgi:hypothetical protein
MQDGYSSSGASAGMLLVPFERIAEKANSETKQFKHVRKMAMFPNSMFGGGGGDMAQSYYTPRIPPTTVSPYYRDLRETRALRSGLAEPIGQKVLSALSRDIVEIVNDSQSTDEQKASDYMHAIKRYLTFRNKQYSQTPVAETGRPFPFPPPAPALAEAEDFQVVSPEDRYMGVARPQARQRQQQQQRQQPQPHRSAPTPRKKLFGVAAAAAAASPRARPALGPDAAVGAAASGLFGDDEEGEEEQGAMSSGDLSLDDLFEDPVGADMPTESAAGEPSPTGGSRQIIPISEIVKPMPARLRAKATKLVADILSKTRENELNWSGTRRTIEIIIRGKRVPGSNLRELVENAVRKTKFAPTLGSRDFLNILHTAGLMSNEEVQKIMTSKSPSTTPDTTPERRIGGQTGTGRISAWNKLF